MPVSIEQARKAKEQAAATLSLKLPVVGLGLTKQGLDYAIKVNLSRAMPRTKLPLFCGGVPLVYEIVGQIRPQT
jgi:hypothetical protein